MLISHMSMLMTLVDENKARESVTKRSKPLPASSRNKAVEIYCLSPICQEFLPQEQTSAMVLTSNIIMTYPFHPKQLARILPAKQIHSNLCGQHHGYCERGEVQMIAPSKTAFFGPPKVGFV